MSERKIPSKAELIAIQAQLKSIQATGAADVAIIENLRPLGYIFIRGDYPGGAYTVKLTRQGKSLLA